MKYVSRSLVVLLFFAVIGCRDDSPPTIIPPPPPSLDDQVIANCYTVQEAVEAFAAQNNGVYPPSLDLDTNLVGDTVIDLLPGGVRLENPFTKLRTEPRAGAPANPGQTGYVPAYYGPSGPMGYVITGMGQSSFIVITLSKAP